LRQGDAVGGHPTQTIICAVYPRSHRARLRAVGGPVEIIDMLNKEINAALADPNMKARLAYLGGTALDTYTYRRAERSPFCQAS
jgi:hypothetical protein